jgi:hypothetical protein
VLIDCFDGFDRTDLPALGALLVVLHPVDRKHHVISGEWIAIMTLDVTPQMEDPSGRIGDLPAVHQHALIGRLFIIVGDQAAVDLTPHARHECRAVSDRIVAVHVVGYANGHRARLRANRRRIDC